MAKLAEGDVFEIKDAGDFFYIQFLGKNADGEIIAVIPQSFTASVVDFEELKGCEVIYAVL